MLAWSKVISNTAAQLTAKAATVGATMIIFGMLARMNDPIGFGTYSLVTTLFATTFVVLDWGLNALFVQQYAEHQRKEFIAEVFGARLLLSLLLVPMIAMFGITLSLLPATRAGYSPLFLLGILFLLPTLCFQALSLTMNGFFQARLLYSRWAMAVVVGAVGSSIGAILLFALAAPLVMYFFLPALSGFLTAAASLWFGRFSFGRFLSWSVQAAWELLRRSFPLAATLGLNVVLSRFDIFLLAAMRGTTEVGQYNVAYLVFSNLLVIPTFMVNTIYPQLVRFSSTQVRGSLTQATVRIFLLSIVVAGAGWIFGPPFISLWLGQGFEPAATTLRILLLGLPFFFLSALAMIVLLVRREWWMLVQIYGIGFVMNVIGNVLLQPAFGMTASAWLTGATELVVLILLGLALLRTKKEL